MFEIDAARQNIAGHADVVLRCLPTQEQAVFFGLSLDGGLFRRGHIPGGGSLARFQDFFVVELNFAVRHFAGVVHAGPPGERRLALAVHDRNGKAGHLLRRRGVFSGSNGNRGCRAEVFPGVVRVDVNRPSRSILTAAAASVVGGPP